MNQQRKFIWGPLGWTVVLVVSALTILDVYVYDPKYVGTLGLAYVAIWIAFALLETIVWRKTRDHWFARVFWLIAAPILTEVVLALVVAWLPFIVGAFAVLILSFMYALFQPEYIVIVIRK